MLPSHGWHAAIAGRLLVTELACCMRTRQHAGRLQEEGCWNGRAPEGGQQPQAGSALPQRGRLHKVVQRGCQGRGRQAGRLLLVGPAWAAAAPSDGTRPVLSLHRTHASAEVLARRPCWRRAPRPRDGCNSGSGTSVQAAASGWRRMQALRLGAPGERGGRAHPRRGAPWSSAAGCARSPAPAGATCARSGQLNLC